MIFGTTRKLSEATKIPRLVFILLFALTTFVGGLGIICYILLSVALKQYDSSLKTPQFSGVCFKITRYFRINLFVARIVMIFAIIALGIFPGLFLYFTAGIVLNNS